MNKFIIKSPKGKCLQEDLSWSLWKTNAKKFDTEDEAWDFMPFEAVKEGYTVLDFDN
jgi:hypothetical protein